MTHLFRHALTKLGVLTAHPAAFVVALCYVAAWLLFSFESFDWHAVATVATLFMALLIQRAEHRDTQAIHAKLDELLRVEGKASSELTNIDQQEPETIERHRSAEHEADK
jgi:low affinity Fe/Cu permease